MHKIFLVGKHEYLKRVRKRSFLLTTLGLPVLIGVIMALSVLVQLGGMSRLPLGYVDHADVLQAQDLPSETISTEMRAFETEEAARTALETEEIQAYYVLAADYLSSREVSLYYLTDPPGEIAEQDFGDFIRYNLTSHLPANVQRRILDGIDFTIRSGDGEREFSASNILTFFIPIIAAVFFFFGVMSSGGYMLQAVTDEKVNRTMEIIATSVSPNQFITGKVLGLIGVVLTQLGIWLVALIAAVLIGSRFISILQPFLEQIDIPLGFIVMIVAFFLPSYLLTAGIMTAIGAVFPEERQGQQVAGIVNMLFTIPLFFVALIFSHPNSPILVGLTLFPTTAFLTLIIRWTVTVVPFWQIAVSWLLLVGTASFSVWSAARIFRIGMLRYGQRLSFQGIRAALHKEHVALERS